MKPLMGIVSSTPVVTPEGSASSEDIGKGHGVVTCYNGVLEPGRIRAVDRNLCCRIMEVCTASGIKARISEDTVVMLSDNLPLRIASCHEGQKVVVLIDGKLYDDVIETVLPLNFCQGIVHFYCGAGRFIAVGRPDGNGLLVSASFFRKG